MNGHSVIRQIFEGKKGTYENVPYTEAYYSRRDRLLKLEEAMEEKLKDYPELAAIYYDICDAAGYLGSEANWCHYDAGVKFGFSLAHELLSD